MKWTSQILADPAGVSEAQASVYKEQESLSAWFDGQLERGSDRKLTPHNVYRNSLVWQALNLIAGDVARVKFQVGQEGSNTPNLSHPLHRVLCLQANQWQTSVEFFEWLMFTAVVWGNALARIVRDRRGRVVALEPIPPRFVDWQTGDDGLPFYVVTWPDKRVETLETTDVVHVKSLSPSGFWGLRLTEIAADELQLVRDVNRHATASYANGARPSGALKFDGKPSPESIRSIRDDWHKVQGGPDNAGRVAIFTGALDWLPLSTDNTSAQLIEALTHNPVVVGAATGVSPLLLGDLRHSATRANLEEARREYFHRTLARYVARIVAEFTSKLLVDRTARIIADDTDVVIGDQQTAAEIGAILLTNRIATRNEVRQRLRMDPVEGGDIFENPAIDTVDRSDPEADEPDDDGALAKARRIRQIEAEKLARQARQSRDFMDYVDKFYGKAFAGIAETEQPGCGDRLASYTAARRAVVIDLAGQATTGEQLAELIESQDREPDARSLAFYLEAENGN